VVLKIPKYPLVDTDVLKNPFLIQEVLKHPIVVVHARTEFLSNCFYLYFVIYATIGSVASHCVTLATLFMVTGHHEVGDVTGVSEASITFFFLSFFKS